MQKIWKIFQNCAWQVGKLVYIKSRFATVCLVERNAGLKKIRKIFKKHLDKSESCAKLNSTQQKQAKVCVMIERFGWSLFESFSGSSFAVGADVLLKGFRFCKKNRKFLKRAFDKSENGAKLNAMLKIERCGRRRFAMLILKRLWRCLNRRRRDKNQITGKRVLINRSWSGWCVMRFLDPGEIRLTF